MIDVGDRPQRRIRADLCALSAPALVSSAAVSFRRLRTDQALNKRQKQANLGRQMSARRQIDIERVSLLVPIRQQTHERARPQCLSAVELQRLGNSMAAQTS